MRIISLLPSATEMVCALGLSDQLVGVTHECDFPETVLTLSKVTRSLIPPDASSAAIDAIVRRNSRTRMPLYQLDVQALLTLQPDLIVTQALCDVCAVDEVEVRDAARRLASAPQILSLEPTTLADVLEGMSQVARAAGLPDAGQGVVDRLKLRIQAVASQVIKSAARRPTVVFLEWLDPLFCGGHWNPELVTLAGGRELIGRAGERSRKIELDELRSADPDVIFIACCGYSRERAMTDLRSLEQSPKWTSLRAVSQRRVHVADGSAYFNRPGPRLVESLEILAGPLQPPSRGRNSAQTDGKW